MTATLDQMAADAQQTIMELQRRLDERTAERDEHAAATRGVPPQMVEFLKQGPHRPASVVQLSLLSGAPYVQIPDLRLTDG